MTTTTPTSLTELSLAAPGTTVSALLMMPSDPVALMVLAHGAGAGMRHEFMERISRAFAVVHLGTMRFQFPYTEAERRRPDPPGVLQATIRSAMRTAGEVAATVPLFAGGKSLGGRMTSVLAASEGLPKVRGLVFLGFPLHPAGKPDVTRAQHLANVQLPMLFLQGTRDKLAELQLLRPTVTNLEPFAHLHIVDGADHSFAVSRKSGRSGEDVINEMAQSCRSWVNTVIDNPP